MQRKNYQATKSHFYYGRWLLVLLIKNRATQYLSKNVALFLVEIKRLQIFPCSKHIALYFVEQVSLFELNNCLMDEFIAALVPIKRMLHYTKIKCVFSF